MSTLEAYLPYLSPRHYDSPCTSLKFRRAPLNPSQEAAHSARPNPHHHPTSHHQPGPTDPKTHPQTPSKPQATLPSHPASSPPSASRRPLKPPIRASKHPNPIPHPPPPPPGTDNTSPTASSLRRRQPRHSVADSLVTPSPTASSLRRRQPRHSVASPARRPTSLRYKCVVLGFGYAAAAQAAKWSQNSRRLGTR
ncbi:hypothetical protein MMC10_005941 [Thelotrema lepadinum]|nr:hypothetical protein [Thelotrema lepadinum]